MKETLKHARTKKLKVYKAALRKKKAETEKEKNLKLSF